MSASQTIKKIRLTLCLDQDEFAKLVGVTKSGISKYESGYRHPRMKTIRKMKQLAEENNIEVKVEDFLD
jgi:predicted transcriptional regulator